MDLILLETDQDLCPGWLPLVPPDLVSPRRAPLLFPQPLEYCACLPPKFLLLCLLYLYCCQTNSLSKKGSLFGPIPKTIPWVYFVIVCSLMLHQTNENLFSIFQLFVCWRKQPFFACYNQQSKFLPSYVYWPCSLLSLRYHTGFYPSFSVYLYGYFISRLGLSAALLKLQSNKFSQSCGPGEQKNKFRPPWAKTMICFWHQQSTAKCSLTIKQIREHNLCQVTKPLSQL